MIKVSSRTHLVDVVGLMGALFAFGSSAMAQVTGELVEPDVMILLDSSASMDWRDPNGITGGMDNWEWTQESCDADRHTQLDLTPWQKTLNTLLGGISDANYRCSVERANVRPDLGALSTGSLDDYLADNDGDGVPDNLSEFREAAFPHFRAVPCDASNWITNPNGDDQCVEFPNDDNTVVNGVYCATNDIRTVNGIETCTNLHPQKTNRESNGILDRYETLARFGLMTYDNRPTCLTGNCDQHNGLWDYGYYRNWLCTGTGESAAHICENWNAGARADQPGAIGGLVPISTNLVDSNQDVRRALNTMEPLYCSPLGSLIDDAGHYFANDPAVLPKDGTTFLGTDIYYRCRPKVAILITDGQPTQAFEFAAGSCGGTTDQWKPNVDPATLGITFNCPWRSSAVEAAELFDLGKDVLADMSEGAKDNDVPLFLVVIGFNVPDVDCAVAPEECIEYTSTYYETRHCYDGVPVCDSGGGPEITCLMTPRQFVNEIACQGWPYDPQHSFEGHQTDIQPPWLDADFGLCGDDPDTYICLENERALFVNDSGKLSKALDLVIGNLSSTAATHTDLVTWNRTLTTMSDATVAQYEIRSGFVARHGRPWQGVLTRKDVKCENLGDTGNLHNAAARVEEQAGDRKLYSVHLEYNAAQDEADYNQFTPTNPAQWLVPMTDDKELELLTETNFDDCDFGLRDDVGSVCEDVKIVTSEVIDYMQNRGLADIYNSNPTLLGPPIGSSPVSSFISYQQNNVRDPYLFVGTNDGVLHAFNADAIGDPNEVAEMWGYIPRAILGHIREQFPIPDLVFTYGGDPPKITSYALGSEADQGLYQHLYLMDGSPVVRDMLLYRDPLTVSNESANQWRAVVVGGLGKGARGYYALDVTANLKEPLTEKPKELFELAPGAGMFGNNNDTAKALIERMGYPISSPTLTNVALKVDSEKVFNFAVAILPGGWKSNGEENTGVYVVRLGDGKLIKYFEPGVTGDDSTGFGMCDGSQVYGLSSTYEHAQLIGTPVVLGGMDDNTRLARDVLIGDDRGRLWIVEMHTPDPDEWCLRLYFDSLIAWHFPYEDCLNRTEIETSGPISNCTPSPNTCFHDDCCSTISGEPVTPTSKCASQWDAPINMSGPRVLMLGEPTQAMDVFNRSVIIFGTGQYDMLSQWNRNRIFSVTDTVTRVMVNNQVIERHKPSVNWWIGDFGREKADTTVLPIPTFPSNNEEFLVDMQTQLAKSHLSYFQYNATSGPKYFHNVGEKLIGRPVVFDGVAYFTTFVPIENPAEVQDACEAGTSRVWAVDYDTTVCKTDGACDYLLGVTADPTNDVIMGKFIEDGQGMLFRNYPKSLFTGVQVVRRPSCNNVGEDVFELKIQKANANVTVPKEGQTPPADLITTQSIKIDQGAGVDVSKVRFDSWSIVFE